MKFEEASLTGYLVKNLEPLTEADPAILAKYVVALLKKDKPPRELQELCTDNLVEFLGSGANLFTSKLFEALEDGSIANVDQTLDLIQKAEPTEAPTSNGIYSLNNSSPKEDNLSSSSESSSDPDDKEISDDDDDRNHKHRRKEARRDSFETDTQEQFIRRYNRKRNKPYENGQVHLGTGIQASEIQKEYNPTSERNAQSKFDKRRSDLMPLLRAPLDLGTRTRFSLPLRNDPGPRFDFSTSVGRPLGRGRGRGMVPWNQHDSRFNPLDTLDFASQMASQGPAHPSLFVGAGLPSAASTQNSSWGGFGFLPGISNGIMDPLNPLGLQGSLRSAINTPLNIGMPRQRCRDFEERGFCLRGDMCPMEHGLNRIVVEDVQSLSQFNLPVSISSSHALGIQTGTGPIPPVPAPSGQLANTKSISSKSSKSAAGDDAVKLDDVPSTSGGADADVYDPDQPLWSNDRPNASSALLRLPSPNIDDEPSWDGDSSARRSFKSDCIESEVPSRRVAGNSGSQNTNSSVWGRIGSGNKSDVGNRTGNATAKEEMNEYHGEAMPSTRAFNQRKNSTGVENVSKAMAVQPFPRAHTDSGHKTGKAYSKALRTLYVNGIPQKSNRRVALLPHFQKFGEVIDIYIPQNSEKAFVQFSKREEAEAALKSPDAVMGNRFIKLSWADRDRISDDGQNSGHNVSFQSIGVVATSVPSKQLVANGGNGTLPMSVQRRNDVLAAETSLAVAGPVKGLLSNAPKAPPPTQKKPESLELLEELRRKQESLAKKRDEFRRQLVKFEKQAISIKKADVISDKASKRQKVESGTDAEKVSTPKSLGQVAEKTLERRNSDGILTNGPKASSSILQQSLKNTNQTSALPVSLPNRFKLDNRSTSFRILPPLPAGLASVDVLRDHFSHYGVISSVVLEELDQAEKEGRTLSEDCSACITFTTRHSAERAYQNGKSWEGHNLKFKWLTVSLNSNSDCESSSNLSPRLGPRASSHPSPVTSGLSSPNTVKSTCTFNSDVAAAGKVGGAIQDIEATNHPLASPSTSPAKNVQFSMTMTSHGTGHL